MRRIYANHNATSPLLPAIAGETASLLAEPLANLSSVHAAGLGARARFDQARAELADWLGVAAEAVVLTASATEANVSAVRGHFLAAAPARRRVLVSSIEHASVLDNARALSREGAIVEEIQVDASGVIALDRFAAQLGDDVALVALAWANNETGAVQPVRDIAARARAAGARIHVDAVQSVGKLDAQLSLVAADTFSLSAHKLGALAGVGALVVADRAPKPWLVAGGQQEGRRGGSGSWHATLVLAAAVRAWREHGARFRAEMRAARDAFEQELVRLGFAHTIVAQAAERLPNTSSVLVQGARGEALLTALDLSGIAVSHGAACSTGSLEPSHVLLAMGLAREQARATVRVSFGPGATASDGQAVAAALAESATRLRATIRS